MDRILESKVLFVVYPKFVMLFSFPSMIFILNFREGKDCFRSKAGCFSLIFVFLSGQEDRSITGRRLD